MFAKLFLINVAVVTLILLSGLCPGLTLLEAKLDLLTKTPYVK
jgi:hypothetical protein